MFLFCVVDFIWMCLFIGVCAGTLQEACHLGLLLACSLRGVLATYTGKVQQSCLHRLVQAARNN